METQKRVRIGSSNTLEKKKKLKSPLTILLSTTRQRTRLVLSNCAKTESFVRKSRKYSKTSIHVGLH